MTTRSADETEKLLAMAAHDLRAPLRQIGLRWALIERRYRDELSDSFREDLASIREEFQQMQALLEDMLVWVAGNERQAATEVDLVPLMRRMQQLLASDLESSAAQLEVVGPFPRVFAREASVFRVVLNLVRNALHHCGNGVHIRVSAQEGDATVRIAVSDNGPGIPQNQRAKIFEPFNRGATSSSTGTGLGLAICQRLVEEEGGRIGLDSTATPGSHFWVELPRA